MTVAATWPRAEPRATRLLHVDPAGGTVADRTVGDLRALLREGDLLVVNDAATLPGSLAGTTASGAPVEVRLWGEQADGTWRAVLFGAGDWRTRTEDRAPPPRVRVGDVIGLTGMRATVTSVDDGSPRLVSLSFDLAGAAFWRALYRAGRPVQYSYVARPLALWHVQTAYAARPWAGEAPSAGFALAWDLLLDLRARGVGLARVTHAAGLSATGDPALDARLPLAERYEVPAETARAVAATRARGGRVVAVGTTVVRALESTCRVKAGGTTDLKLGRGSARCATDAILTGMHEVETSHFALLEAFAPREVLVKAQTLAEEQGYVGHEFGDAMLVAS